MKITFLALNTGNRLNHNFKGILFDVHRTLVDDSGFSRDRIWRLMQQSGRQINLPEYFALYDRLTRQYFYWPDIKPFIKVREIHRRRLLHIYQHFDVHRDITSDVEYLWHCMGTCNIFPEVFEILPRLPAHLKLALLSNADNDDPLIQILLRAGFRFEVIVTSEQLKIYKPAAALFDFAIQKMGLNKDEVLMVGDSPVADIWGAKNAGVKIAWINRQQVDLNGKFPKPDFELPDLKPLLALIQNQ